MSWEHLLQDSWTAAGRTGTGRQGLDLERLLCPAKELRGQALGNGEPLKGHVMIRCGCEDDGSG